MIHVEYVCFECGETYLPDKPGDTHDIKENGDDCGGVGYFAGIHFVSISPPELAQLFRAHDPYNFDTMKKELES